jgi:hypothetical protein
VETHHDGKVAIVHAVVVDGGLQQLLVFLEPAGEGVSEQVERRKFNERLDVPRGYVEAWKQAVGA